MEDSTVSLKKLAEIFRRVVTSPPEGSSVVHKKRPPVDVHATEGRGLSLAAENTMCKKKKVHLARRTVLREDVADDQHIVAVQSTWVSGCTPEWLVRFEMEWVAGVPGIRECSEYLETSQFYINYKSSTSSTVKGRLGATGEFKSVRASSTQENKT